MNSRPVQTDSQSSSWKLDEAGKKLLLRMTQISVWIGIPLSYFAHWQGGIPFGQSWLLFFCLAVYSITAYVLILRGQYELAVDVFLWSMLAAVLAQCMRVNGIRTPIAALLPVILMLCGWLRGPRQAYAMCAIILIAVSLMSLLAPQLWPVEQPRTAFAYWSAYAFGSVLGAILSVHIAKNQRRQYRQMVKTGEELQARVEELQATQDKFTALFQFTPVPVSVSLVKDGTYYDVNPAWERISGWCRDEVLGKTATDIAIWVTTEERAAWIAKLRDRGHTDNQLVRFRLKTGEVREFLASNALVTYNNESCVFASFVDVTDQRNAEARLRELNIELEDRVSQRTRLLAETNQSLSETVALLQRTQTELVHAETLASLGALVAGVAHELNTPIGSAVLISSTFAEDVHKLKQELVGSALRKSVLTRFVDDAERACELLGTSLHRARDLVNSFKTVAMDQSSERRRVFDLAEVLGDALDTLRPGFKHLPIRLSSELTAGLRMDSFPGPLCQVLSNLVQNAVMHGLDRPEGGRLIIRCHALDEERVQLEVGDDGVGIRAEDLAHIFDPFFTTRLGSGGSGLGLSIVHGLVNTTLGGSITVSARDGGGTNFSVILPRVAPGRT